MAQNVTINRVAYSDVPAVDLPRTGGGTARFVDTSDADATAGNILTGKTAYVNGAKITGTVSSKGTQTYTPTTANQTIAAGQYLSGAQTILGDANLLAKNIAEGVTIFGIVGTHSGGGGTATVVLLGAASETVSYTGAQSGNVTLAANGVGSVTLARGSYVFTGGVSGYVTGTISITGDTTVYVRPQKSVYWYGAFGLASSFVRNIGSKVTYTESTNNILMEYVSGAQTEVGVGCFKTSNQISFTGSTRLVFRAAWTKRYAANISRMPYLGYYSSVGATGAPAVYQQIPVGAAQNSAIDTNVTISGTSGFPGCYEYLGGVRLYAIWLE